MTNLILFALFALLCILLFLYFRGRGKRIEQKTPSEKIAHTLKYGFEAQLNKLSKSIRNPEVVKRELNLLLDKTETALKINFKNYLENLLISIDTLTMSLENLQKLYKKSESRAKTVYLDYLKTNDPEKLKVAKDFIVNVKNIESKLDKHKIRINELNILLESANYNHELQLSKLAEKRSDVAILVYSPEINLNASFADINSLLSEFDEQIRYKNINTRVKNMVNATEEPKIILETYSESELNEALEKLLK